MDYTVYVYVLQSSADGRFSVGMTEDLERRLKEHTCGKVGATKYRRPLALIHSECHSKPEEARTREKYLKSGKGREELRKIIGSSPAAKR